MEQLLLVTSCDSPAGIGASLRTDNGWAHSRDVGNSILDGVIDFKSIWIMGKIFCVDKSTMVDMLSFLSLT